MDSAPSPSPCCLLPSPPRRRSAIRRPRPPSRQVKLSEGVDWLRGSSPQDKGNTHHAARPPRPPRRRLWQRRRLDRCFRLDVLGESAATCQLVASVHVPRLTSLSLPRHSLSMRPSFSSLYTLGNTHSSATYSATRQSCRRAVLRTSLQNGQSSGESLTRACRIWKPSVSSILPSRCIVPDTHTYLACPSPPLDADVASHRAQFDRALSTLLYVITSGLQWAIVWWYRREPVFWMPAGWVPRGMDRWLSFGGAPRGESIPSRSKAHALNNASSSVAGSVSVTVWSIVCKKVAGILAGVVAQWVPNPFDSARWNRQGEKCKSIRMCRSPGF
jgi:hypothetical protein